jgi:SAM-dependent methyltransferase
MPDVALLESTAHLERPGGYVLTQRLLTKLNLADTDLLVEIGCGQGATLHYIQQKVHPRSLGIDASLAQLRSAGNNWTAAASGQALPLADESAAAVIAECTLTATQAFSQVVVEAWRILKPSGILLISDIYLRQPDQASALKALNLNSCLPSALSQAEIGSILRSAGFGLLEWQDASATLRDLNEVLTLTCGSASQYWRQRESEADAMEVLIALHRARLGYFTAAAQKGNNNE